MAKGFLETPLFHPQQATLKRQSTLKRQDDLRFHQKEFLKNSVCKQELNQISLIQ